MRKWQFLSGVAIFVSQVLFASPVLKNDTVVDMTAGYRQDSIDFHYAAIDPATHHTKRGLFKADPLRIFELGLKLKYALEEHWYLRGFSDFGWIVDGSSHVSSLFSPAASYASGSGHTLDLGGALGYTVFLGKTFSLAPIMGWGYERLKTHAACHLKTTWNGPFIGVDCVYQPNIHLVWNSTYAFQIADQRIQMHSSNTHLIHARSEWGSLGNFFLLGVWYRCYSGWRFGLEGSYLFYKTFKDPHMRPSSQLPFYEDLRGDSFRWNSVQGLFSFSYDF